MRIESEQGVKWRGAGEYNHIMGIIPKTFGGRIKLLLEHPAYGNGMSQKELAAAMEISEQFLSALIKGRRNPNVGHLRLAAKALNTSVSFLALTTEESAPDVIDNEHVPFLSPQADEAAQLIDAMTDPDLRDLAIDLLRTMAMHDVDDIDPSYTSGGAKGKRLILGKYLGKKAAPAARTGIRSNSE